MNLAKLFESIAALIPEEEAIVWRDRRYTYEQLNDRSSRFNALLQKHGLGINKEREALENWESGQDHVGIYLYNCNEYLEAQLGAFKARCAPFNVNYRYVEEELLYLFDNADAKAIVFHASFAPVLEKIKPKLSRVTLWLQVGDDSGTPLMEGALDYEEALASVNPVGAKEDCSYDDLYIVYTGGTTGMPKGVLWRQQDLFYASLYRKDVLTTEEQVLDEIRELKARGVSGPRGIPAPPFMHASSNWFGMSMWYMGGCVVIQSQNKHLDADDIWSLVEKEKAKSLVIVGDAFAVPLIDQLEKKKYDLSSLRLLMSGGAIWSPGKKKAFTDLIPHISTVDALGSSETGTQASQLIRPNEKVTSTDFSMKAGSVVLTEDLTSLMPKGSDARGWLGRTGWVPLGYYKDAEKTRKTFPVIDGVRYSVPGDRAILNPDGSTQLLGRDSVTINTGGEKVFAEEVEHALKCHPAVYDVVVCGTPSERWGQQVSAIVKLREGITVSTDELKETAGQHIARYKLPKVIFFVDHIVRAPSGKPDYRWAKATALELVQQQVSA